MGYVNKEITTMQHAVPSVKRQFVTDVRSPLFIIRGLLYVLSVCAQIIVWVCFYVPSATKLFWC